MLAPRIAIADKQVAGIIIAAGTAQPLENVIVQQLQVPRESAWRQQRRDEEADRGRRAREDGNRQSVAEGRRHSQSFSAFRYPAPISWICEIIVPAEVAAQLQIPILVLQGGRDYQVTSKDYDLWKAALAKDSRATFKLYPGLTHLFMTGKGSGPGIARRITR